MVLKVSKVVPVPLEEAVYKRLQGISTPFEDTPSTVIARLLDLYDEAQIEAQQATSDSRSDPTSLLPRGAGSFKTVRGTMLPVGLIMKKVYGGRMHVAEVTVGGITYDGKTYNDPSSAAVAVKKSCGAGIVPTNGWMFWMVKWNGAGIYGKPLQVYRDDPAAAFSQFATHMQPTLPGVNDDNEFENEPTSADDDEI